MLCRSIEFHRGGSRPTASCATRLVQGVLADGYGTFCWWSMSLLCGSCRFSGAVVETVVLPQLQLVEHIPGRLGSSVLEFRVQKTADFRTMTRWTMSLHLTLHSFPPALPPSLHTPPPPTPFPTPSLPHPHPHPHPHKKHTHTPKHNTPQHSTAQHQTQHSTALHSTAQTTQHVARIRTAQRKLVRVEGSNPRPHDAVGAHCRGGGRGQEGYGGACEQFPHGQEETCLRWITPCRALDDAPSRLSEQN